MQDRKDLKRLDIRRDDIMIQQYSTVEYLACVLDESSKGRFCNTIASVALGHTSIQSD